ncbi:cyclase family protein [Chlorobium ferrooxidans]|uniref:Putative cyclase n=1 Tax=Chlorobium ferrooxidans DSM 13031 TaxID=377431 RepID=Q0YTC6_9CHLB|nr:cyclase family protein [Chlorobium ferrooxidans]EAT59623.1 Putative cyclase [Chlorobium ferrooxidans DSM 13031]
MRVIDLTHTIEPGMPVYPGTPEPEFQPLATLDKEGFAEQLITLSSHTGTHIDLPAHIFPDRSFPDVFSVEQFTGKGVVMDVRDAAGGVISKELLKPFSALIGSCDFLLLCSGWSDYWGWPDYFRGYPVFSVEAAHWLTGFELKGIGVDMISVDLPDAVDLPVHRKLLGKGIVLIENLTALSSLPDSPFTFCAFPLKIAGAEASPIRAVALVG